MAGVLREVSFTPSHLGRPPLCLQFDLAESRPAPVLRTIWDNLLAREEQGDALAGHVRRCAQRRQCLLAVHAATTCGRPGLPFSF